MTPVPPPTWGSAIPRQCTRWVGDRACGKEPVLHVAWHDSSAGFVCQEHSLELGTVWIYERAHTIWPDCGMPGSYWIEPDNLCRCDDQLEPALEHLEAATPA